MQSAIVIIIIDVIIVIAGTSIYALFNVASDAQQSIALAAANIISNHKTLAGRPSVAYCVSLMRGLSLRSLRRDRLGVTSCKASVVMAAAGGLVCDVVETMILFTGVRGNGQLFVACYRCNRCRVGRARQATHFVALMHDCLVAECGSLRSA